MELKIFSYNCGSIRKRIEKVKEILIETDILVCQEIMLLEDDCHLLNHFDPAFDVAIVPSKKASEFGDGRPIGGLAIFYRKNRGFVFSEVILNENFMVANIIMGSCSFYIINVYMPCDNRTIEALTKYQNILGEIQSFLNDCDSNKICILGDFNADPSRGRFWNEIENFLSDYDFKFCDDILPENSFTYLNTAYNTTTWIDHIISSKSISIDNIAVHYDLALYDHFPISATIKIDQLMYQRDTGSGSHNSVGVRRANLFENYTDFSQFSRNDVVEKYNENILKIMADVDISEDITGRNEIKKQIDNYYSLLVYAMKYATQVSRKKKKKFKVIAGWNDFCKDKYRDARDSFLLWVNAGKPQSGTFYEEMILKRKIFRKALNYCKCFEQQIRDDKLAKSMMNSKKFIFWKEVRDRTGKNQNTNPDSIDGIKESQAIAEMFAEKFSAISGIPGGVNREAARNCEHSANTDTSVQFNTVMVDNAIIKLKTGKDFDGLDSKHFKYLNCEARGIIAKFFNMCILYNYIPDKMLIGVIRPRIKNKFGNIKDSTNYREVMISSMFLKILEYMILPFIIENYEKSISQFGYRKNTSTKIAVTVLKEVINKYLSEGSVVYSCFMDLSKAFERVDHNLLMSKLRTTAIPAFVVNIIDIITGNGSASVLYDGHQSRSWKLEKGVRQGGVFSAHLFIFTTF